MSGPPPLGGKLTAGRNVPAGCGGTVRRRVQRIVRCLPTVPDQEITVTEPDPYDDDMIPWELPGLDDAWWASYDEHRSRTPPRPIRPPWTIEGSDDDAEHFGINGDHEWAITRWADPKYL